MTNELKPRVRVAKAEMDFPHEGELLTAVHPLYGPASSVDLLRQIRGNPEEPTGYREPDNSELISFVHEYFSGSELQAQDVTQTLNKFYFRSFTGVLFAPEERIAYFQNSPVLNERGLIDVDSFMKNLDQSYASVPFEFVKDGNNVAWRDIRKHPYFLAWAGGEEGAEKLTEIVSRRSGQHATLWAPHLEDLTAPTAKITAMYTGGGNGLHTYCTMNGDAELSFSFGIMNKKI
jgi:hypothetical protein